jgi:activating signal cointegrator complex subunit 3
MIGTEVDTVVVDEAATFVWCTLRVPEEWGEREHIPASARMDASAAIRAKFGKSASQALIAKAADLLDQVSEFAEGSGVSVDLITAGGATSVGEQLKVFGDKIAFQFDSEVPLSELLAPSGPQKDHAAATIAAARASAAAAHRRPSQHQQQPSGHERHSFAGGSSGSGGGMFDTGGGDGGDGDGNGGGGSEADSDPTWLVQQLVAAFPPGGGGESVSVQAMAHSVYELLEGPKEDETLQNDLFELLGVERFGLITSLLSHRHGIVSAVMASLPAHADVLQASSGKGKGGGGGGSSGGGSDERMTIGGKRQGPAGASVSIQSAGEKAEEKRRRKEAKRQAKADEAGAGGGSRVADLNAVFGFDPAGLREKREQALRAAADQPLFARPMSRRVPQVRYPGVFDSSAKSGQSYVSGMKLSLPVGTTRKDSRDWEHVSMPASAPAVKQLNERTIPISELSDIGQLGFKGYKALNRVQSFVYESAYTTNENLLICAPTGAGKTNIAMMTILRCVEQHVEDGVIQTDKFKVVYIAPMKALAAEMTRSFGKRLAPLGLSVKELTGDMQLSKMEILATNMLVVTPEKWDVVTRKSTGDVALTQMVKLLIIDEVHLLHDERGPAGDPPPRAARPPARPPPRRARPPPRGTR